MKKLFLLWCLTCFVGLSGFSPLTYKADIVVVHGKETVVYITKTGKKYHRGNCSYLKKSKIEISKSKARGAGYTPCKVCKP